LIGDYDNVPSERMDGLPRLVHRNLAFHQSSSKVHLRHNQGLNIYRLLRFNWFHVLLRWPTKYSFSILMIVWTASIVFFAWIYVWHDEVHRGGKCVLGGTNGEVIGWAGAFAFSLQTCSTVGKIVLKRVQEGIPFSQSCELILSTTCHRVYLAKWSQLFL
jgi:hypothetical protein